MLLAGSQAPLVFLPGTHFQAASDQFKNRNKGKKMGLFFQKIQKISKVFKKFRSFSHVLRRFRGVFWKEDTAEFKNISHQSSIVNIFPKNKAL